MRRLFFISILLVNCVYSIAQDSEKGKHRENHYHLSGFAGFTTDYSGKNGYKLGIEYEYRMAEWYGLGGTFDFTGADFKIFALSVGADFYPFKRVPLIPGIGVGIKNKRGVWDPFARAMLYYDFHIKKISIGPMIMYDFFPNFKDIMSYGVTVGFSL